MRSKLYRCASSYWTTMSLLVIYAVVLAVATVIEKLYDTATAKELVYHAYPFILLHVAMVVNLLLVIHRRALLRSRRWGLLATHFAFVVILVGAMTSHLLSEEGYIHLREGERSDSVSIMDGGRYVVRRLPFSLELEDFSVIRYPGSQSPSSYESHLRVDVDGESREELIYMNNVLDIKGYRLYQASFDTDEMGSVLSVNRDVAGRNITYCGYALLLVGLILSIVGRRTRFAALRQRLSKLQGGAVLLLCVLTSANGAFAADQGAIEFIRRYGVDAEHAERFGAMPVQSTRGRIMPINTFSSEILRKVHHANSVDGMNPDQFLLSFISMPAVWLQHPFISLKEEVSHRFSLPEEVCSYADLFDEDGVYLLQETLNEIYERPTGERGTFDKEVLKLDERANILFQLANGRLLKLFPHDEADNHAWYAARDDLSLFEGRDSMFVSKVMDWYTEEVLKATQSGEWGEADRVLSMVATYQDARDTSHEMDRDRLRAELLYNRLDIFRWCKRGALIFGAVLLILSIVSIFRSSRSVKWAMRIASGAIAFVFVYLLAGILLRWCVSGSAPSNSYETMVYVSWAVLLGGAIFARRSSITFALATIFSGVILFVSSLSWLDPEITPLVPVLKSPWLISHVTVIITSYGFMGISALVGIANLVMLSFAPSADSILQRRVKELTIINEMSMWLGIVLLAVGIFLGAIWANESWGRYWGWDPKEVWALITMILYAVVLHMHLIERFNTSWWLNVCSVFTFASVLMTYFGVNYLLSGMHSYGNTDGVGNLLYYIVAVAIVVVILSITSRRGGSDE